MESNFKQNGRSYLCWGLNSEQLQIWTVIAVSEYDRSVDRSKNQRLREQKLLQALFLLQSIDFACVDSIFQPFSLLLKLNVLCR